MGDNTYNQYKCADSNYGTIEPCGIPGQFCFTSFTDWDGDGGMVQSMSAQIKEYSREDSMIWDFTGRRPLPVRAYVVSIGGGPKLRNHVSKVWRFLV